MFHITVGVLDEVQPFATLLSLFNVLYNAVVSSTIQMMMMMMRMMRMMMREREIWR